MATAKSNEQLVLNHRILRLIIGALALAFPEIDICTSSSLEQIDDRTSKAKPR